MATYQLAKGHDVEILTLNKIFHSQDYSKTLPKQEMMGGLAINRVSFIGKKRFFIPLFNPIFFKRFDIIHVHNTDFFFDYCALFGTLFSKKIVATTHGGFFHTDNFSLVKKLYFNSITKISSKAYKTIFAISRNDYKIFEGMNKNLLLLPNAVEPLGNYLSKGRNYIYLGRLASHKDIENVMKVFAILKEKSSDDRAMLHIIGPQWDIKSDDLNVASVRLGIQNNVLIHGYLYDNQLQNIVKECGYFLSASRYEGFGMTLLETMSVGMIPFVQPNESFQELVNNASVGLCVDYSEPQKAAEQILAAQKHVKESDRVKAKEFAALYSWKILTDKILDVYKKYI